MKVRPNLFSPFLRAVSPLLVAGFSLVTSGCGPELDPVSRIETIRIIGVSKSAPYAQPGETVNLRMLWEEGRDEIPEKVETFFGFWCLNPPGDLFSQCLSSPPSGDFVQFELNSNTFDLEIPEESLRESVIDPRLPESGTAYVFYGICAGTLEGPLIGVDPGDDPFDDIELGEDLIPRCLDEDGNELGADDFIIGYSTIFVYEDLRNENPLLTGFQIEGEDVAVDCVDDACDGPFEPPALDGCEDGVPCLKACEDDGDSMACPAIEIGILVDEASAEADEVAKIAYNSDLEESIWVSYFVDRGTLAPELKLVNDAVVGWQEDFSTSYYAPKEPGPLRIWAAVRDNRGGIAWTRTQAYVE